VLNDTKYETKEEKEEAVKKENKQLQAL